LVVFFGLRGSVAFFGEVSNNPGALFGREERSPSVVDLRVCLKHVERNPAVTTDTDNGLCLFVECITVLREWPVVTESWNSSS
jgi:hypothetical protein